MERPKLLAYSVESLVSEKFQAMIDLAEYNSRMKDFYDIYTIIISKEYDNNNLKKAVINTFKKRNTTVNKDHALFSDPFVRDKDRLVQWKAFLRKSNLNSELKFSEVMVTIKKVLEPIYSELIKE